MITAVMVGAACAIDAVCYLPSVLVLVFVFVTNTMLCAATRSLELRIGDKKFSTPLQCNELTIAVMAGATPVLVFLYIAFGVTKRNELYTLRSIAKRLMGRSPGCS